MHALLEKDYVLQSIDSGKHHNAQAVIAKVRTKPGGGIPWMAIVDADGKVLTTSDGPQGNVGCPWKAEEIAWFREMLATTKKNLTDADLDRIVAANEAYRDKVEAESKKKQRETQRERQPPQDPGRGRIF